MGSITEDWLLKEFAESMSPHQISNTSATKPETKKRKVNIQNDHNVALIWPTAEFVKNSIGINVA